MQTRAHTHIYTYIHIYTNIYTHFSAHKLYESNSGPGPSCQHHSHVSCFPRPSRLINSDTALSFPVLEWLGSMATNLNIPDVISESGHLCLAGGRKVDRFSYGMCGEASCILSSCFMGATSDTCSCCMRPLPPLVQLMRSFPAAHSQVILLLLLVS